MATSDRAAAASLSAAGATRQQEDIAARRQRRIAEFQASVRPRIAHLTLDTPALEDLAESFPGLLFALSSNYNNTAMRELAIEMTLRGANLRHIADALELPMWLRRLPPAAFTEVLPRLPSDTEFALRLGSFIPNDRRRAAAWLTAVSDAYLTGGREFALWTARAWCTLVAAAPPNRAGLVAAWHWFSLNPGSYGHSLLRSAFDPRMTASGAVEEFNVWMKRVALVEWLGAGGVEPWIPDARLGAYEFQMLRRAEDFIATAAELDNCLEQFATRLGNGMSSVAKIMRGERVVACIEIGLHDTDQSMPAIVQLRGHKNKKVPAEVWRKAYDWLSHAPIEPFQADRLTPTPASRMAARQDLWLPFIVALEGHADPAGRVAAQRLRRTLLPRLRAAPSGNRRTAEPAVDDAAGPTERQTTMLQRVREHLATLAGFSHADHELMRWDSVERLEVALRGGNRPR